MLFTSPRLTLLSIGRGLRPSAMCQGLTTLSYYHPKSRNQTKTIHLSAKTHHSTPGLMTFGISYPKSESYISTWKKKFLDGEYLILYIHTKRKIAHVSIQPSNEFQSTTEESHCGMTALQKILRPLPDHKICNKMECQIPVLSVAQDKELPCKALILAAALNYSCLSALRKEPFHSGYCSA